MRSKSFVIVVAILFALAGFGGGYLFAQTSWTPATLSLAATTPEEASDFAPFWEVWDLVHTRYYQQPVDDTVLMEGAINGMLSVLEDPHTRYLSPEAERAAQQSMEGEIQGIGAEVEAVDDNIVIVSPIEGSPAEAAGLLPGDILRQADGVELTGMNLFDAAQLVRGPAGTAVHLVVERNGELLDFEIVRDVVRIISVRGEILEDGLAYIRLSHFGTTTDEELEALLPTLLAENPAGLILDLRRNPGGALDTTVNIADEFLDEGAVLVQRFGDGQERIYESSDAGLAQDIPIVVLIDEGSASASEVLAGAIRDRDRGILIGQSSFGKGTVQTWHTLSNEGGVRITIAEWLTPGELSIHENGLDPDYFIPLPEAAVLEEFEDTQLQAAIDYLQGEAIISIPPEGNG
jgi:carboxyl-terminal processing protease